MEHRSTRRLTSGAAVIAIVLAALSPLIGAASAQATAGYVGVPTGDAWVDSTLAPMAKDVEYSSTLTLPSTNGTWFNIAVHYLPAGLYWTLSDDIITVSGTPTDGGTLADFYFDADGVDGAHTILTFYEVYIDPGIPATSTTVISNVEASPYTGLNLAATVFGNSPTGSVEFFVVGGVSIGTVSLLGGVATFTGPVDPSYIGQTIAVRAVYNGDLNNAYSATTVPASVHIFASLTVSGTVSRNGSALVTTVELQHPATLAILATTTSTGGAYSFTIPGIDTLTESDTQYLIRAQVGAGYVYYSADGGPGAPNQVLTDADYTTPTTWGSGFNLYDNVAPVWSDTTLASSAVGTTYSNFVAATGTAVLHYVRTGGALPLGLTLDELTGEIHGTPLIEDTKTFTITASNDYGSVEHEFSMTTGPAGVAPTWSETAIEDLTVGVAVSDSVTAVGDPTIVYSVAGDLPTGLALDTVTGAITGTPTEAGDFEFTLTATNAFGHVDEHKSVTVVVAPELDLQLQFAPGTDITDAKTEISADGLQVGSTYTLYLHSTPILLYSAIVDATGGFSWLVTIPANTPVGAHELILTGVAPDGTVMTAHAWFTLRADGTIGAISYLGPLALAVALAFTGSEPLLPLGIASLLVLGGYLALRRSRSVRAS
jgi:hypothetical protein